MSQSYHWPFLRGQSMTAAPWPFREVTFGADIQNMELQPETPSVASWAASASGEADTISSFGIDHIGPACRGRYISEGALSPKCSRDLRCHKAPGTVHSITLSARSRNPSEMLRPS